MVTSLDPETHIALMFGQDGDVREAVDRKIQIVERRGVKYGIRLVRFGQFETHRHALRKRSV